MKIIDAIINRFKRKPAAANRVTNSEGTGQATGANWPVPDQVRLDPSTRIQMQEIGPDAFITNGSAKDVMLEGTLIRRLFVPAGKTVRVVSPVLERVYDVGTRSTKIQEWDAFQVADNMVKEFARSLGYDELTPAECREVTFPIPDRMLGRILQRVGLRVHY